MRYKNYLTEKTSLDDNEAISYIKNNCMDAFDSSWPLYRGLHSGRRDDFVVYKVRDVTRVSPYAENNIYNLLLSNLPSWKKYPQRNLSYVCTTDMHEAETRGSDGICYVVLPVNGTKVGICPENDIWYSFSDSFDELNKLNYHLKELFGYVGIQIKDGQPTSYVKLIEYLDRLDDNRDDIRDLYRDGFGFLYNNEYWSDENTTALGIIESLLDPSKNGFKIVTVGSGNVPDNREVWFQNSCIMINLQFYDDIELGVKK
jgi:hypothetical protein